MDCSNFYIIPRFISWTIKSWNLWQGFEEKIWKLKIIDIRKYAFDKYKTVDDTPYGGGAGMLMKADVLANSIDQNLKKR